MSVGRWFGAGESVRRLEERLGLHILYLSSRISKIEDRLRQIEDGDERTGSDTTPTCGSTVGERRCPTCGKKMAMTNAERQRRWRERHA